MTGVSVRRSAIRFRRAAGALVLLLSIGCIAASAAEEPPPLAPSLAEMVPVLRPATENAAAQPVSFGMPLLSFWQAESAFQAGQAAEALSRFLDLAYGAPDDERKGFVWMRVGDLLLSRREYQQALEAADKAVSLSRGRFLVLSSMELKFRIYRALRRMPEARQVAASLLAQHYVLAEPVELLAVMARADASGGNLPRGLDEFRRAIAAARSPEEAADLRKEREALIDALASIPALREAAEEEEEAEVKGHLYLVLGRHAARMGYPGMGAFALGQAARAGGERGEEAARQLYRLEQIIASRPKIVGILPLSGKHADIGFAILTGAEVALRRAQGETSDLFFPVMRWRDSAARPEEARREYEAAARDGTVVGILGPLTGEEGYSVSMIFGPVSPPVLYLGQKAIPEKPFLFRFGLTPIQEARAVLEHFSRQGAKELLLFHPTNGYGEGFADAVRTAAKEQGIVLSKTVSYDPDTNDFTEAIRKNLYLRFASTLLIFAVGFAFAVSISGHYVRPLEKLALAAEKVAAGDLSQELPVGGKDEVGRLTRSFNEMIAHLRQNRELEEKVRESQYLSQLGRLSSGVAHEIRNPLNFISLAVDHLDTLADGKTPEAEREKEQVITGIKEEIQKLNELVTNFIMYGRPAEPQRTPVRLREIVEGVLQMASPRIQSQRIRVSSAFRDAPPQTVDPDMIRRAVINLVGNAVDAMPGGGELRVSGGPGEDGCYLLEFGDTGGGIAESDRERIFEPYFTTKSTGLGLGLVLTRRIVESHGGGIVIDSEPGKGTRVVVRLPGVRTA
ncbi:MAG TPA: hypothetical protein DD658_08140 [Deltaproteobacteria bacterium]|nr:hypothetical protein [Deltaproteobacteria bacterium]